MVNLYKPRPTHSDLDEMGVSELFMIFDLSHHEEQPISRTYLMVYETLQLYTCF